MKRTAVAMLLLFGLLSVVTANACEESADAALSVHIEVGMWDAVWGGRLR